MYRFKMLLGVFAVVMIMVGCGGKDKNPLAPESTMREYAQTEEPSGVTAAA
ncbi:hypothetical protein HY411_01400, partial [Candidatus Gottesmanbacteria bacterium]|nr:hypothetical protein [Candidatus Gottesmanbacteria bacterium]